MLQKLNERIHGVIAWVVISLVAITFALFGIDYYRQSHSGTQNEVDVNGVPITKQAFELKFRRIRQQRDPSLMTPDLENQLKQQVLDEMVLNSLSTQAARSNGFHVNALQANAAIVSIPQFQQDGHFSEDRYQQALNSAFYTPESFEKEVEQGMLLNQQRFLFVGTSFALPSEIKRFIDMYMQTRTYDYLQIPVKSFIKQVDVSQKELEAYYQKNQKLFLTPEKVSVDYINLSMSDIKRNIKISDEQVKRYYEENQTNFYTPAQWRVAHILFAIPSDASEDDANNVQQRMQAAFLALQKDPTQFDNDVKAMSDDKISAAKGGILPWIVAGQSEFDKTLVTLTKVGQISEPVKSEHGYEIFKLVDYKPAKVKPLSEIQSTIHAQLAADLAQTKYEQIMEKLSDLSYQTPDSLTPVADALQLKVETSKPFSRKGGDDELSKNKQVINAAFSNDVLAVGNNSEPVQLNNESVIVLRVNKHLEATQRTFDEVKAEISQKLSEMKARKKAIELGKAILVLGNNSSAISQLITQHKLSWHKVTDASRDATEATPDVINALAFTLPKVGSQKGQILSNGDYVVVDLKQINPGKMDALDKEQLASISQQIEANIGMMDYDLYVGDLRAHAKLVRN